MIRPRRAPVWFLVCVLACLFVLSMVSPQLWCKTARPSAEHDLAPSTQGRLSREDRRTVEQARHDAEPRYVVATKQQPGQASVPIPQSQPLTDEEDAGDLTPSPLLHSAPSAHIASRCRGLLPDDAEIDETSTALTTSVLLPNASQPTEELQETAERVAEGLVLAAPAGKIGAQANDSQETKKSEEPESGSPSALPESMRRLPMIVANIPSPIRAAPHEELQPSDETSYPATDPPQSQSSPSASQRERVERSADDAWREPATLMESLNGLVSAGPTSKWANDVIWNIKALGPAIAGGSDETMTILERLAALDCQTLDMAKKIPDRLLAQKLRKAGYALGRRLDVWQEVVRLGVPQSPDNTVPETDPRQLALCLAEIDSLTRTSAEGRAWQDYLLVDALRESAKRQSSTNDLATRKIAQQVLARLTQTPLTSHQQKFVASGPVAALRAELRRLAAEPIGAATVLRDIETYERSSLPSDARRLALDCQNLAFSPVEGRRQLAERVDLHYRNANLRIAVTEELINRMIPERNLEYTPVEDTVLGRPVTGESLMATEVGVRLLPDRNRVRMALEVRGEISATTIADAGAARFHNDSESYYVARKPLEIDMTGVRVWPVEVGVQNETRLRDVDTPFDWVPLFGAGARWMAKSQSEQNKSAASQEVKQKIAAQARERVDAEARQRLTEFVDRMNERVFDPLNALSLDPQMIAGETTEKRLTMRLRLAGEDQLGSHTPRPQAPADCLASVQIHESAINNCIQRLQLNGRTFTLPELSQHVATRLNRPASWEITPDHADVKITFAEKDAVLVRCQDGQFVLTLSIAQLSKSPRKWKDFQIRAFYRPQVSGRSAQLARDGVIYLIGRLNMGSQIALRGIFSRALSKNNAWDLVPPQIVKEPKLNDAATRFVIDDGWIGVSLGPKSLAAATARRPRSNAW